MDEHCADHSGNCARLVNLETEQGIMKTRLDKIWYLMLATLVGVIGTLVAVIGNQI